MAATVIRAATTATTVGTTTRHFHVCSGGVNSITTEANSQRTERTGGVYSSMTVKCTVNASNNTTTVFFRKNSANGNQNVSFAAAETGTKQDLVNTDNVAIADVVNIQLINTGVGNFTYISSAFIFSPNAPTTNHYAFNSQLQTINAGITDFFTIGGDQSQATRTDCEIQMKTPGTMKNMGVRLSANTLDVTGTCVFTLVKSGVATAVTISFASGETGVKEDTANTDTVVVDDLYSVQHVNTGITGSVTVATGWISLETTNNKTEYICNTRTTRITAQTRFFQSMGNAQANSGETTPQNLALLRHTFSNLRSYVSANTWTGNLTTTFRINAANGNESAVHATTVTGWVQDAVNTDLVVATDLIDFQHITSAGSGSVTVPTIMITATMSADGGSTLLMMGCG